MTLIINCDECDNRCPYHKNRGWTLDNCPICKGIEELLKEKGSIKSEKESESQ
jgi:hypothetical protein